MTNPRSKKELLSETTKSYLRELWIKEVFDRERYDTTNKYTSKGIQVEPDSMDLVHKVTGEFYVKNREKLQNDFISGTPDIIIRDENKNPARIKDIKSSWDIWTFAKVDYKQAFGNYYWQLFGYMWLTETLESDLLYCLVNTPDELIESELYKLSFKIGDSDEVMEQARKNYEFDDIPVEMRLKQYVFQFDTDVLEKLKERIVLSREFLNTLTLDNSQAEDYKNTKLLEYRYKAHLAFDQIWKDGHMTRQEAYLMLNDEFGRYIHMATADEETCNKVIEISNKFLSKNQ